MLFITEHYLRVWGYERPFSFRAPDLFIGLQDSGSSKVYVRECRGTRVEKILAQKNNTLIINPVEPVNLPEEITHYLEIAFCPVVLPAGAQMKIFLTFPVEIGVFIETGGIVSVLDIFSFASAKYSLYGIPSTGLVTRWYSSEVHHIIPATNLLMEGVLYLMLNNRSTSTVEVARIVLERYGMCLFYGDRVRMTATMDILSPTLAETTFAAVSSPGCENRSIDLYAARKFVVVPRKTFMMESGMQ